MLRYWEVLKFAVRNGYKVVDFGRSSRDSYKFRFKQQWDAMLYYPHYWLGHESDLPTLNSTNLRYALLI